jgi:alkanesulfonate monooxygenase SsuD/methylene tetrahydromethanopterin reductase-like flavin-dependent oxidoreductase (luciferase family)
MKAWTHNQFSHEGKFRRVQNLRVIRKPVQKLPPVYVASIFTPESFEWTGRMGYNLMVVPYAADPAVLAGNIKLFRDTRTAHGYSSEPDVMAVYHFYCGETAAKAKEEPQEAMLRYLGAAAEPNREPAYSDQYRAYGQLREGFKAMMNYEVLYPQRLIFGDPAQCIERIKQVQATGATHIGLLANFGGLEHGKIMASLERFAREVMPVLRRPEA